jgi:hypothetical protein
VNETIGPVQFQKLGIQTGMPNLIDKNKLLTSRIQIKSILDGIFKTVTRLNKAKMLNQMNFDQFILAMESVTEKVECKETTFSKKFKYLVLSISKHINDH